MLDPTFFIMMVIMIHIVYVWIAYNLTMEVIDTSNLERYSIIEARILRRLLETDTEKYFIFRSAFPEQFFYSLSYHQKKRVENYCEGFLHADIQTFRKQMRFLAVELLTVQEKDMLRNLENLVLSVLPTNLEKYSSMSPITDLEKSLRTINDSDRVQTIQSKLKYIDYTLYVIIHYHFPLHLVKEPEKILSHLEKFVSKLEEKKKEVLQHEEVYPGIVNTKTSIQTKQTGWINHQ